AAGSAALGAARGSRPRASVADAEPAGSGARHPGADLRSVHGRIRSDRSVRRPGNARLLERSRGRGLIGADGTGNAAGAGPSEELTRTQWPTKRRAAYSASEPASGCRTYP